MQQRIKLVVLLHAAASLISCSSNPIVVNGPHPDAVGLLADLLAEASSRAQLIVTTHSDALISALTDYADSVLVCEHRGGTVVSRVDSEQLQDWLQEYRLGELWIQGKLGGNP